MKLFKLFIVLPVLCSSFSMCAQTMNAAVASPGTVCAFITGRMNSALPQVPTLCSGGQHLPGYLDIDIFAGKDVFQTDTRRAWSSAFFQTLQGLQDDASMKAACFEAQKCIFSISDNTMAEGQLRYRLILDQDMMSVLRSRGANYSDPWYVSWWNFLMVNKSADHPQSKENAGELGKDACDAYLKEARPTFLALDPPGISCSMMLVTDQSLVLVIDFNDSAFALSEGSAYFMPQTIGKMLDQTGYKGDVIIRSPWNKRNSGSQFRVYKIYDLGGLEFAHEEFRSGTRSETSAGMLLIMGDYQRVVGQTESDTLNDDATNQYIVKESQGPDGARLIDTSDGAEWQATADSMTRCPFVDGDSVSLVKTKELIMFGYLGTKPCQINVSFARGW